MRKIDKSSPPECLTKIDSSMPWGQFITDSQCHRELGDSLYAEQHGLCCYCESAMKVKEEGHIEHYSDRKNHINLTYDYDNMGFSCNGRESPEIPKKGNHCGHYRKNQPNNSEIPALPHQPDTQLLLIYDNDGTVAPNPQLIHKKQIAQSLIDQLDLNHEILLVKRREHAKRLNDFLNGTSEESPTDIVSLRKIFLEQNEVQRLAEFHSLSKLILMV